MLALALLGVLASSTVHRPRQHMTHIYVEELSMGRFEKRWPEHDTAELVPGAGAVFEMYNIIRFRIAGIEMEPACDFFPKRVARTEKSKFGV